MESKTSTQPEVVINIWCTVDEATNLVYTISGRAYCLAGSEGEKLRILKSLAETDYHLALHMSVPKRFTFDTGDQVLEGVFPAYLLSEPRPEYFEELFQELSKDSPTRARLEAGQVREYRMAIPNNPLTLTTCLLETRQGELIPIVDHYNLPEIQLDVGSFCVARRDLFQSGRVGILGRTFAYNANQVIEAATHAEVSIDEFFSSFIARGMEEKKVRRQVLFFYCLSNELFFISACTNSLGVNFKFLYEIPGYFESADELVRSNASPYMYWDGNSIFRLHKRPNVVRRGGYIVEDFCALIGESISAADADFEVYDRIRKAHAENYEYSAVPTTNESAEIKHVFYQQNVNEMSGPSA